MRVVISSHGRPLDAQIKAYAEYRIFAVLATRGNVAGARVRLHAAADSVQCHVHVTLEPGGSIHARTTGAHAAAAIDRAADRLAVLMDEPHDVVGAGASE